MLRLTTSHWTFFLFALAIVPNAAAQDKKPRGKFAVGKETTYVTGPLDADGYIDYAAALNQRLGKGVTADNNANVPLSRALGPRPGIRALRPEYFQLMGIAPPPEEGEYFVPFSTYKRERLRLVWGPRNDEIIQQLDRAEQRPWKESDYPQLADWLKLNEKPLALAIEASKRDRYFCPFVPGASQDLISSDMLALNYRELTRTLLARAMLRTGHGALDRAWQDLLACHRLSRLVGAALFIDGLVGTAVDITTFRADMAFLDVAKPNAMQLDTCLSDLQHLSPRMPIAQMIDLGERFFFLDLVMSIDRNGIKYLDLLFCDLDLPFRERDEKKKSHFKEAMLDGIDWDPALKTINRWFDRQAAVLRIGDRTLRLAKLAEMETELTEWKGKISKSGTLDRQLTGDPKACGTAVSNFLFGDSLASPTTLTARNVQLGFDRVQQMQDNAMVAFALCRYHRDHKRYPTELAALAPKYLAVVPADSFSGKPLIYKPDGQGFLLYSVGPNGQDDGGRGLDTEPKGDDVYIRFPLPELRR